ncbi:uncharacterized protein KZ484_003185 [Pholidichthys leucotaenia]
MDKTSTSLPNTGCQETLSVTTCQAISPPELERFDIKGSWEWLIYGGTTSSSKRNGGPTADTKLATSPSETGRFGRRGSGEGLVYGGSLEHKTNWVCSDGLPFAGSKEFQETAMNMGTSPPQAGRFSSGSGEWRVYGGSAGHISSGSLPQAERKESPSVALQRTTSPPSMLGRFSSGGSGEWRVYSGYSGRLSHASSTDRSSVNSNSSQVVSPPSSYTSSGPRHRSTGSGGRLSIGNVVRRSSSVGSDGMSRSSSSGKKLSHSPASYRISSTGRYTSTGSGEWKPVYSSASGRRSSVGRAGRTSSQRTPSPGGKISVSGGSGGWLSTSSTTQMSTAGTKHHPGSNEKISSQPGGRISSSSGSGRTNSTGGRVISSRDRPIRSTGSGAGSNKERISVCKIAALSMSAAGRERSQERQRQQQRSQQQQQAAANVPLIQHWLITSVGVTAANSDGIDDIMPV